MCWSRWQVALGVALSACSTPSPSYVGTVPQPLDAEVGRLEVVDAFQVTVQLLRGLRVKELVEPRSPSTMAGAAEWGVEDGARVEAFVFGGLPEELKGTADTVLFIRALHNLARFEDQGGFLTQALRDAFDVLKPGGTVGVVQHEARPDMPDDWANGDNGYLKWDFVVGAMEAAGFEFVAASDLNENPLDQPTVDDKVWRLPPVMNTSRDDPALRAQMMSIGESNRMTLKFRKPEQE